MDLGGSGDLRVLVYSVAVGPVIHEPKTRPSLSRAQLREVTPTSWAPPNRSQGRSTVPLSMQRFRNNGLHSQPSNTTQ